MICGNGIAEIDGKKSDKLICGNSIAEIDQNKVICGNGIAKNNLPLPQMLLPQINLPFFFPSISAP